MLREARLILIVRRVSTPSTTGLRKHESIAATQGNIQSLYIQCSGSVKHLSFLMLSHHVRTSNICQSSIFALTNSTITGFHTNGHSEVARHSKMARHSEMASHSEIARHSKTCNWPCWPTTAKWSNNHNCHYEIRHFIKARICYPIEPTISC